MRGTWMLQSLDWVRCWKRSPDVCPYWHNTVTLILFCVFLSGLSICYSFISVLFQKRTHHNFPEAKVRFHISCLSDQQSEIQRHCNWFAVPSLFVCANKCTATNAFKEGLSKRIVDNLNNYLVSPVSAMADFFTLPSSVVVLNSTKHFCFWMWKN